MGNVPRNKNKTTQTSMLAMCDDTFLAKRYLGANICISFTGLVMCAFVVLECKLIPCHLEDRQLWVVLAL